MVLVDMAVSGDLNRNEIRKIEPALYGVDPLYKELQRVVGPNAKIGNTATVEQI